MARQMKESGVSWIGQVPQSWKVVRTKNCYTNKKQVVGDEADNYERLALTLNGVIKRPKDDSTGLQPEEFDSYQVLRENELVFKLIDLANVATSRVGYSPYVGIVSPAYIILHPRNDDESRFGEYYFLSMWQREVFNHMGDDGVRSSLNATDLLNIPYLSVPNDEKQKIVKFLDKTCAEIEAVVAKTKATIEEYKKLKQSIITEAVTKGIRGDRPMKDSGIEWIDSIPVEWDISRTKMLFTFGKGLPITKENLIETGVPVISYGQIHSKTNSGTALSDDLYRFVSEEYLETNASSLVNANDFIVADTSEDLDGCGNCVFVDSEMVLFAGYHTIIFRSNTGDNNKYLAYLFKTDAWRSQIRSKVSGVKLFSISKKILSDTTLLLPSIEERAEIVAYLDAKCAEIDNIIASKTALLEEMETYKKSVIYEYVTGKKEVL